MIDLSWVRQSSEYLISLLLINVVQCVFAKQCRWYQQRRIVVRKDSPIRKTKEIQFSLETVESKKVSLFGEFNDWYSDVHRVPRTHRDELPDPSVLTKMVPCSPCTWG